MMGGMSLFRLWQPLVMDRNQLFYLAASQGRPKKAAWPPLSRQQVEMGELIEGVKNSSAHYFK